MGSLGNVAYLQGDYTAARYDYERAQEIFRQENEQAGEATTLMNLGTVYAEISNVAGASHQQGELATARMYFERALTLMEAIYGPEHPDTATVLSNLANVLQQQGDLATARIYFDRAHNIGNDAEERKNAM